jgi:hypothetical protein
MTLRPLGFAAIMASLLLGGCNPTTVGVAASPFLLPGPQVNFMNANHAAIDTVVVKAGKSFPKGRTVMIAPFREIVDRTAKRVIENPGLGAKLEDDMVARFIQLGYTVVESGGQGRLEGVYEVIGNDLAVRLRLKDSKTDTLYTMHDYWLPLTASIRRHMNPNSGGIPLYKAREGLEGMINR